MEEQERLMRVLRASYEAGRLVSQFDRSVVSKVGPDRRSGEERAAAPGEEWHH